MYSGKDDKLVFKTTIPLSKNNLRPAGGFMGETQWREAEASGCSFVRSRSARLRRSFACSPDKTASCAFLFPTPTSINPHFARCLRDTHARRSPLEVCKEDSAFVRSLMETKEFAIEMASCNIECHPPNVYLNGNHALRTQPRLFSYLVADN